MGFSTKKVTQSLHPDILVKIGRVALCLVFERTRNFIQSTFSNVCWSIGKSQKVVLLERGFPVRPKLIGTSFHSKKPSLRRNA